jgi:hypothetical protein
LSDSAKEETEELARVLFANTTLILSSTSKSPLAMSGIEFDVGTLTVTADEVLPPFTLRMS